MKAFFTIVAIVLSVSYAAAETDPTNYVVIGAFTSKEYAMQRMEQAKQKGFDAHVELNPDKQLYYVFVMKMKDHDTALMQVVKLQTEAGYKDAWVFVGLLGDDMIENKEQKNIEQENIEPGAGRSKEVDVPIVRAEEPKTINEKPDETPVVETPKVEEKPKVPYNKGENTILNVLFFKDAAIMKPDSKPSLDKYVLLMKDYPIRIRIHGHTNGNAGGKIIEMGDKKSFFSLYGSKETRGSAKELSEKRGLAIRDYLVQEGIEASRMEVKAWGGKKPLFDKRSHQAANNVRVEVEIIE